MAMLMSCPLPVLMPPPGATAGQHPVSTDQHGCSEGSVWNGICNRAWKSPRAADEAAAGAAGGTSANAGLKAGLPTGVCWTDPERPCEACDACIGRLGEGPDAVPVALPGTEVLQTAPNMVPMRHDRDAIVKVPGLVCPSPSPASHRVRGAW